jgi:hypothetical protein
VGTVGPNPLPGRLAVLAIGLVAVEGSGVVDNYRCVYHHDEGAGNGEWSRKWTAREAVRIGLLPIQASDLVGMLAIIEVLVTTTSRLDAHH